MVKDMNVYFLHHSFAKSACLLLKIKKKKERTMQFLYNELDNFLKRKV